MASLVRLAILASALSLFGCHTMHFEVSDLPHEQVIHQRKDYFLWGLVPHMEVDVSKHCPYGVAAVREEMTFVDGLCQLPTLGIWAPRSSWYYCLPAPTGGAR